MRFRIDYDEQTRAIRRMDDTIRSPIPGSHQVRCSEWQNRCSSGRRGRPEAC
jgi:hypothetical protein